MIIGSPERSDLRSCHWLVPAAGILLVRAVDDLQAVFKRSSYQTVIISRAIDKMSDYFVPASWFGLLFAEKTGSRFPTTDREWYRIALESFNRFFDHDYCL